MINYLKYVIVNNWSFARYFRLSVAVVIAVEAFMSYEIVLGVFAIILFLQSLTNIGCCSACIYIPKKEKNG